MNLAAWGFRTPEAFERHCNPVPPKDQRKLKSSSGSWVTPAEIEAYAATLTEIPSSAEVWRHFGGSPKSAYNYRRKVIAILARRGDQ